MKVVLVALLAAGVFADFGFTRTKGKVVVDVDSIPSFTFAVEEATCDIKSFVLDGQELQSKTKGSHIGSGLSKHEVKVNAIQKDDDITVTCTTPTLTHYYVAQRGRSDVYMATYITAEPAIGELRYIARLDADVLPDLWPHGKVSNTANSTGVVEGSDVFRVGNETRSKFYSSDRFIDDKWHCVAGSGYRVCFIMPGAEAYESSSGGPFHRDINANNVGSATHLTFYMNSNHVQTESPYRMGLYGPYVLSFRKSDSFPSEAETQLDTSFFANLDVQGYVPKSARGQVEGRADGTDESLPIVLHWFNDAAQYWTVADENGAFISPHMKAGVYTQVLYQDELEVARVASVQVARNQSTKQDITSAWPKLGQKSIFQIGTWDGKPAGFSNADKQLRMHPSDQRMDPWMPMTFRPGQDDESTFPMALFKAVNSPLKIEFELSDEDLGNLKLRIGTTLEFSSARPQVTINGHSQAIPTPGPKINSRGVTRGAYRGYGKIYDTEIPVKLLRVGTNSIRIDVASGSDGVTFLSPNFIIDAVQLWRL